MRKLGTRLGAGATSLYRHVANKDELIELAIDEIYGEIEIPVHRPRDLAHGRDPLRPEPARDDAAQARWIASVLGEMGMSYLGPNAMRLAEFLLALFARAGLPTTEADQAASTSSPTSPAWPPARPPTSTSSPAAATPNSSTWKALAHRRTGRRVLPTSARATPNNAARIPAPPATRTSSTASTASWTAWKPESPTDRTPGTPHPTESATLVAGSPPRSPRLGG